MNEELDSAEFEPGGGEIPGGEHFAPSPPPGINDAIAQMNQRLEDLDGGGQGFGYPGQAYDNIEPEFSPQETVNQIIDERVQERLDPVLDEIEIDRRRGAVQDLIEQYPRLRSEETLGAVEQTLAGIARTYGDPSIQTDPGMVELAYLANEARAAAASPPEQPATEPGQHLETGAGPGAQPAQTDPVTAAYANALAPAQTDPYGMPLR